MNLNNFNDTLLPEWDENHPENFLQQLFCIKEQGLLVDPDIIFAFLVKNERFSVYENMTISERTDLQKFANFIRKEYAGSQVPYLFERLEQDKGEDPASFLTRVKKHYYLSRDCIRIPHDSDMAEIEKNDVKERFIFGLNSYEVRKNVRFNCTKYENLIQLTREFTQSIKESRAAEAASCSSLKCKQNQSSQERTLQSPKRSSRSPKRSSRSTRRSSQSPERSFRSSRQWSPSPNRSYRSPKRQQKSKIKWNIRSRK